MWLDDTLLLIQNHPITSWYIYVCTYLYTKNMYHSFIELLYSNFLYKLTWSHYLIVSFCDFKQQPASS